MSRYDHPDDQPCVGAYIAAVEKIRAEKARGRRKIISCAPIASPDAMPVEGAIQTSCAICERAALR